MITHHNFYNYVPLIIVVYNDCKSNQQVTDSNSLSCSSVREPSLSYNANTAKDMAKWSSLAYVSPTNDKNRMQSVVATEFGANYRVSNVTEDAVRWRI